MPVFDRRAYIVDDNAELRKSLRRVLTSAGIYSEEFDCAEAFLGGYRLRPAGCVLLDVGLSGMNGLELLTYIKKEPVPHSVIMLSGEANIAMAVRAVKAGALDFVQKPFRTAELLMSLNSGFDVIRAADQSRVGMPQLTKRENQILAAFAGGKMNKTVAEKLGISIRTVEMHRANILKKLNVDNLTQALFLARDNLP